MEIPVLTPDIIICELIKKKLTYGKGTPSFADKFLHNDDILNIYSIWNASYEDDNMIDILRVKISDLIQRETWGLNQIWNR